MSVRTIVEFNHDYAHKIAQRHLDFMMTLDDALRTGDAKYWEHLRQHYGVIRHTQCHHSDERQVIVNGLPAPLSIGRME